MADLKYNYQKDETPEERLRNKLQSFYFLVAEAAKHTDLYEVAKMCDENIEDIDALLDDIQPFYTGLIRPVKGWEVSTIDPLVAKVEGTGREVWRNKEEGVEFTVDPKNYEDFTTVRVLHSQKEYFILSDIAWRGSYLGEPAVEAFKYEKEAFEKFHDETYYWDNSEWVWSLGINLLKGDYNSEQVTGFIEFVERHGYDVAECINDFLEVFKQSIKLNFWNG